MEISTDKRIEKFLYNLPKSKRVKIDRLVELFTEKGFLLSQIHLKKITKRIWELKPGSVRLLLGMVGKEAIILNAFIKKTAKTPIKEIKTAEQRLDDYL